MNRCFFALFIWVGGLNRLLSAQEVRPATPTLRTDSAYSCSAEPQVTPLPELWSDYPGELKAELIIKNSGEVQEAKALQSTYRPAQTESALKVLKTWQFAPATKNAKPVSLRMNVTLKFSMTSANLEFDFLFPQGHRGCLHTPIPIY